MMAPRPRVQGRGRKKREGKGFSPAELKKAGLSLKEAVRLHIPIDPRRKTADEENVEAAKAFVEQNKKAAKTEKPKRKSKS